MKKSLYNILIPYKDKIIIFNTLQNKVLAIFKTDVSTWGLSDDSNFEDLDGRIKTILFEKGIYVSDDTNELEIVRNHLRKTNESYENFTIIINTTLKCNFSCWYCYENHSEQRRMSKDDIASIEALIYKESSDERIKTFNIQFFGGEPTLCFNSVIQPLLERLSQYPLKNKQQIFLGMTTNGYLLNDKIIKLFSKFHSNFEITLDGNRSRHNQVRFSYKGQNTYDTILRNITKSLSSNIRVTLRLNISEDTDLDVKLLLADIKSLAKYNNNLAISVQKIWQANDSVNKSIKKICESLKQHGFNCETAPFTSMDSTCYADKKNEVVINPGGKIYKCTARDFEAEQSEGCLTADGSLNWNKRHTLRENATPLNNSACRICKLLPICIGGCSQKILEANNNVCPLHKDSKDKLKYAKEFLFNELD